MIAMIMIMNEADSVQYDLVALATHLGEHIHSGHYRALLYNRDNGSMHYCDDDKRSRILRTFASVACDVYAVFMIKRDI